MQWVRALLRAGIVLACGRIFKCTGPAVSGDEIRGETILLDLPAD